MADDVNNLLLKLAVDNEIDIEIEGVEKRNVNKKKGKRGECF